jgi:hypothetical protein
MSKSVKDAIFFHLGFFWCLPISVIAWLLFGILYLCKQIDSVYWSNDLIMVWEVKKDSWLDRNFLIGKGWAGFSMGCNILIADLEDSKWLTVLKHEREHCYQQYKLGVLMPVLYILDSIRIYLCCPELHCYYDNRFETDARKAAGQPEKIPRDNWREGPDSRWFW